MINAAPFRALRPVSGGLAHSRELSEIFMTTLPKSLMRAVGNLRKITEQEGQSAVLYHVSGVVRCDFPISQESRFLGRGMPRRRRERRQKLQLTLTEG